MCRLFRFLLCFIIITPILNIHNSFAYDFDIVMKTTNETPISGEEFTVTFVAKSTEPINISAYRLKINYDSTKLSYKGLYSDINNDDFKSYTSSNQTTILYVTSETGFHLNKNSNKNFLELNFKVLSSSNIGKTTLSASIDGIANYDTEEIPSPSISNLDILVSQSGDGNCDLYRLETSGYKIYPAFSPDVTKYYVDVPYSKSVIEFNTSPVDSDASVKINRKTLKSAGSSTDINVTVTSADKKSRKIYNVTVNRLNKSQTENKKLSSYIDEDDMDSGQFISNNSKPDSLPLQNNNAPLVIIENSFNPVGFVFVSVTGVSICIYIMKRKHFNN